MTIIRGDLTTTIFSYEGYCPEMTFT